MKVKNVLSDQFINWSVIYDKQIEFFTSAAAQGPLAAVTCPECYPPRLAHRAVQALWKSWLQMRQGTRPWPKILSLRHAFAGEASDRLRSPGLLRPGEPASRQLPFRSRDPRGDLRNQPRTPSTKRTAIGGTGGQLRHIIRYGINRYGHGGDPGGQYASAVIGCLPLNCGGREWFRR